ncbi:MAG: cytochrome-c peroxidase [Calditrichaeota bacterium]|nr:MAG: cytochrome-c peroxidase [Calditrichota bacterium]
MKKLTLTFLVFMLLFLGVSCSDNSDDTNQNSDSPTLVEFNKPKGFPNVVIPEDNPQTVEGIKLGRMLYYDRILDKDSSRACASCHLQNLSFSSPGAGRDVMAHVNMAWQSQWLWDGKVEGTLEEVMIFEAKDFFEANLDRLRNHPTYPDLFEDAFGTDKITYQACANALAQFTRTMVSFNSKYDKFLSGQAQFSESEERGYDLFYSEKGDCFHCHGNALLTDRVFHNTGVDPALIDIGLGAVTGKVEDFGKFKTPTLRNIEMSAPYMHDGRFQTLEEVLDFYNAGGGFGTNVDPLMRPLGLDEQDKSDLIAFLKTFTDSTFLTNPKFANPFEE